MGQGVSGYRRAGGCATLLYSIGQPLSRRNWRAPAGHEAPLVETIEFQHQRRLVGSSVSHTFSATDSQLLMEAPIVLGRSIGVVLPHLTVGGRPAMIGSGRLSDRARRGQ